MPFLRTRPNPKKRIEPGIEEMRRAVNILGHCSEEFNQRYAAHELLELCRQQVLSGFDIVPDKWTEEQRHAALAHGVTPHWDDDGEPMALGCLRILLNLEHERTNGGALALRARRELRYVEDELSDSREQIATLRAERDKLKAHLAQDRRDVLRHAERLVADSIDGLHEDDLAAANGGALPGVAAPVALRAGANAVRAFICKALRENLGVPRSAVPADGEQAAALVESEDA